MPSLMDIGKSAINAQRQALNVTGQNIANVNTEGYKKRETALEEVTGAGGGVTEISDQTGLGVRVEDIKRAFDEWREMCVSNRMQSSLLSHRLHGVKQKLRDLLKGDKWDAESEL